jgi:hypothetical protein
MSKNSEENREKINFAIGSIEKLLEEAIDKCFYRDLNSFCSLSRLTVSDTFLSQEPTKIKTYLFDFVDKIKNKYEKVVRTNGERDIFADFCEIINTLFPFVFPIDLEEFQFRKLMEKTFLDKKINKMPYLNKDEFKNKDIKKY